MRNPGLLAFGVTTLLLVPAVVHELTAGPKQVAQLVAPGTHTARVGAANVDVSVDHGIIDPGGTVRVTLRASSEKPEQVSVGVVLLEELGTYNGRVPEPAKGLAHHTLALEAKPGGGATKELAFQLPGGTKGAFGSYTVLVTEAKVAAKLERLRKQARREGQQPGWDAMESPSPRHGDYSGFLYELEYGDGEDSEDDGAEKPGKLARVSVTTRPKDSPVALALPERAAVGDSFVVAVTVKNPGRKPLTGAVIALEQPTLDDYIGLDLEHVEIEENEVTVDVPARQSKRVEFRVKAKAAGILGLSAQLRCDDCNGEYLSESNLDAIEIVPAPAADAAPPVVAQAK